MPGKIIAIILIVLIIGSSSFYIIKSKKNGRKCIGCPDGKTCKIKKFRENIKEAQECCCSKKV